MNPLLSRAFDLPFDEIRAEHVEPAVREALEGAERDLNALEANPEPPGYANTLAALDALSERLGRVVTIAAHLNAVADTPELRAAYNRVVPLYSAFFAKLPLNEALWRRLKAFAETPEARALTGVRARHLAKTLREFERAGAKLSAEKKARVEALKVELSQLQTRFAENVLDSTNAFELLVADEAELAGLPESALAQARASAQGKGLAGYRFTLQLPSYLPFMQYAENRALRERMYRAYMSRASAGEHDNTPLIRRILALRRELARLLGHRTFADYRLSEYMVPSGAAAQRFEEELYRRTLPYFQREVAELERFAKRELGLAQLEPWDLGFVSERLRQARLELSDEQLRPYFPLEQVLAGLFEIAERLFGVSITARDNPRVWHPDVRYYELRDATGLHLGSFYADLFPREEKRAGAWMNRFITGGPTAEGGFEPHLGLICANFTQPRPEVPALLTHREVETTFHEFGHLLHQLLSRVEVRARAGTNVVWDFVELPSQIMENWTYEPEALALFARHHQTGEPIPEALVAKLRRARTFLAATAQMRQLSFGTVDLALHIDYDPEAEEEVIAYGQRLTERFAVRPEFAHNHFLTAFSHVFAGGYAAAYYSYKWSEMLEADAFTRFAREGIFNPETGHAFAETILAQGDSADAAELYRAFMGRDPDMDALIDRNLGPLEPAGRLG